jgi:hypothetical protein
LAPQQLVRSVTNSIRSCFPVPPTLSFQRRDPRRERDYGVD